MKDGTFRVYVRLTYKESFETFGKPPDPTHTFDWRVAAVVISEEGRFVVNDVLLFEDDSTKIASRLTKSFTGCDGPRCVGIKANSRERENADGMFGKRTGPVIESAARNRKPV
jgi:hypothetical protein